VAGVKIKTIERTAFGAARYRSGQTGRLLQG